jgi:hypothetical protein
VKSNGSITDTELWHDLILTRFRRNLLVLSYKSPQRGGRAGMQLRDIVEHPQLRLSLLTEAGALDR